MAGKTRPTNGTKIDGKYDAAIMETPFCFYLFSSSSISQSREKRSSQPIPSQHRWGGFRDLLEFLTLEIFDGGQGGNRTLDSALRKRALSSTELQTLEKEGAIVRV